MIRLLTILLLSCLSLNAAIPIIFTRPGTNAPTDTNVVETDIFIVETEDFNANSGQFLVGGGYAFNTKSLYYDSNAVRFIDHDITPTTINNDYRLSTVDIAFVPGADPEFLELFPPIAQWTEENQNYHFSPTATQSNDWLNYTRTWTNANYHVYARMSHSLLPDLRARLSKVTSDRTLSNQTTVALGDMTNSSSGSWNTLVYVELRTNGVKAAIPLNGVETIRFTHATDDATQCEVNHLQFRRLEAVATTDALVSGWPGSNAFANNRSGWAYRGTQ